MLTFNNALADLFRSDFQTVMNESLRNPYHFSKNPLMNISDTEKEVEIQMVVPGLKKSEIEVSLDNNLLTVTAKTDKQPEGKNEKYLRKEFETQSFVKSFRIDSNIDQESILSKLEDGVLTIQIPKTKKKETKKLISIF